MYYYEYFDIKGDRVGICNIFAILIVLFVCYTVDSGNSELGFVTNFVY